jgi:hypothetical protein
MSRLGKLLEVVADYTIGTAIVLSHLVIASRLQRAGRLTLVR